MASRLTATDDRPPTASGMMALLVGRDAANVSQARLVSDYPLPEPLPGEVRIRPTLVGICNTDLEILRGYAQFEGVIGHEFVGIVDAAEDADLLGHRVVGEINAPCGHCSTCLAGLPTHCLNRTVLGIRGRNGTMAEATRLPVRNLHSVPDEVSNRAAVFAEPLAAACEIVEQVHVRPTDRVIVLGDGKLGLLVAQVLSLTGCNLTAVGRHSEKLAILARLGIKTALPDMESQRCHDLVVDCTGNPSGFELAQHLVRPRGTIVLKSTYHGTASVDLSRLVVDEISLVGSRCGPFPPALRLLASDRIDVESLIEAEYPLARAPAALEHAARPGALKVLVRP